MGLDVYAKVVFGKIVDRNSIIQTQKIRTCSHQTNKNNKFCPECGQPMWTEKQSIMLDCNEKDQLSYFYTDYENQEQVVVGFILGETSSHRNNNLQPFFKVENVTAQMKQELIDFFAQQETTLNEDDFEIYVFNYFSY